MKFLLLILSAFSLLACSSYFTRKNCEATNWFEYGKNVALDGRRLSGDAFISQCYKADGDVAESALDRGFKTGLEMYCQPETVFQTGKAGKFFSTEMCTGQGLNLLHQKHQQGVLEYCQKSNGYAAGAKGTAYNKICPAALEAAFLPEFNRGRKKYLSTLIYENEKQVTVIDRDVARLTTDLRLRQLDFQRYQYVKPVAGQVDRSAELSNEVRQLQMSISSKRSQQERLREQNRKLELEIIQLN